MTASEVVNRFLTAVVARDYDTALPLLAEDVVFHNIPIEPIVGRAGVQQAVDGLLAMASDAGWDVLNEAATDDLVINERLDWFVIDGERLEFPVAGVFEVRDGLITSWRDYFDLATVTSQLAKVQPQ